MAFWRRINQSKLQLISNQYRRFYFQAPQFIFCSSNEDLCFRENPFAVSTISPLIFTVMSDLLLPLFSLLRIRRLSSKTRKNHVLNKQITASFVRLVTQDGQHSVVPIEEALQQARKLGVDLVEVQKKVDPPVCKLMDYNKEMFQQRQKEKEIAKSKAGVTVKKGVCNIRFTGKIEEKDLKLKAENVIRLMERGYRVKCMAMAKGKEDEGKDLGAILSRLTKLIEDVCVVESGPNVEKTNASVDESTESGSESEDTTFSDEDDLPMSSPMQMQDENVDNRYKRSEPRKQFPPGSPVRSEPQFRYSPRQPPPHMGQNTRQADRSEPQSPFQQRQPPQNMNAKGTKQVENEASKPPKSFGIFSSLNPSSSGKQGAAVDAPVSNEGNRYASVRNRGMGGNVANPNSAGSQFNGSRKPDNNTGGQDKFGIFSTPNRKP
ncbi:hypothetical protein V6N11_047215 [Hibiscus sabdariffa]|uniref:Translation initiation factor IF-3 n=1 Tax=Hibiscus sabdariffa TaxID=183260 RepID=A0ABR1ZL76_9ROSI